MAFLVQDAEGWRKAARRVLLVGDPNSGKSFSLRTWPGPQVVVAYPGEKGTSSISEQTNDGKPVKVLKWADEGEITDWAKVVRETKEATASALSEKPLTFAGDGLHKLYSAFLAEATFGASAAGRDFDAKLYGAATTRLMQYVDLVARSTVENVVFTVWGALEKDDPDDRGTAPSRHVFPDLPGQAAKRIMGEFSLVLYANRAVDGKYVWQTQPMGKVWGSGLKMPHAIASKIPLIVPQDWATLAKLIFGETKAKEEVKS